MSGISNAERIEAGERLDCLCRDSERLLKEWESSGSVCRDGQDFIAVTVDWARNMKARIAYFRDTLDLVERIVMDDLYENISKGE